MREPYQHDKHIKAIPDKTAYAACEHSRNILCAFKSAIACAYNFIADKARAFVIAQRIYKAQRQKQRKKHIQPAAAFKPGHYTGAKADIAGIYPLCVDNQIPDRQGLIFVKVIVGRSRKAYSKYQQQAYIKRLISEYAFKVRKCCSEHISPLPLHLLYRTPPCYNGNSLRYRHLYSRCTRDHCSCSE